MNATVTTSAKKSAVAKKPAITAKIKPVGKPGEKLPKKLTNVLKGSSKDTKIPVKTVAKSLKTAVKSIKSSVKLAAKSVAGKKMTPAVKKSTSAKSSSLANLETGETTKQAVKAVKVAATKTASFVGKTAAIAVAEMQSQVIQSGVSMSSNKASAGLADKIEKTVVSKVREVATKTTKSTPDVLTDGTLITEAQILKMSDKEYMNAAQLAFFKARLQQLEKDLLKNAGETTEHLRETVLVPDPADRATIEEEHALELRTRDRERKLLKKVQQSIASIDSGDYGWCEETGEPIGIPRLLARPTATLSLEAQQRRELKQKLYGD
jgi:DnaK suppressor protein